MVKYVMTKINGFSLALLILISACIFPSISGCQKDSEEDKVRTTIVTVRNAAEDKDLKTMLSHIAKTYRDRQGNDYDGIKNLILFYFFRHQKISVLLPDIAVSVDASSAAAHFEAILSSKSGSSGTVLPEALGAYRFDVSLIKDQNEWKIVSADWQRVGEADPGKNE